MAAELSIQAPLAPLERGALRESSGFPAHPQVNGVRTSGKDAGRELLH